MIFALVQDKVRRYLSLFVDVAPSFALLIRLVGYFEISLLPGFDSTVVDQVALFDLIYFFVDSGLNGNHWGLQYQCGRLLLLSSIRCTATRVAV